MSDGLTATLRADLAELLTEVERLRRWKAEASEVILGLQDVGKALGLRPGEWITGASATEAAKRLSARAEAAEAEVERLRVDSSAAYVDGYDQGNVDGQADAAGEVERLRAEIRDRESERADLRDRVQKAEAGNDE